MPLPMAQIPQFSLGATPTTANIGQGINEGLNQGYSSYLAQQALAQKQQELEMAKQQQTISQVDTLLKAGLNYDGMLPSLWPAIATRMNTLSPDYKLDPSNPPENIQSFAKRLSSISDGLNDKVFSPPQAHNATVQLIQDSFPQPVAGTMDNSGQPVTQAPQGQPSQQPGMAPAQGQPTPQQGAPQPQQPPSNPLTDFATIKAQYDKANQLISQAPMEGPQSQDNLRKQLEASSLGLNYKKALDNLSQQYGEGQQNNRNQMNQNNEMAKSAVGNFQEQSKEFTNVASNFSSFNHLMQMSSQMENNSDTTATVNAEKTALLSFAQMAYPGTGRPGNQEMLENMEKSGPYGTLISQYLNRLDKGDIMTPKQIKGLRQTALTLYQGREAEQTQLEKTYAPNLQQYGANPQAMLPNVRPQSVVGTSALHPSQSTDQDPLIGHVRQFGSGKKVYLGGNKADNNNWADAEDNGQ